MDKFIDAFINQWIPIVNHWLHLMSAILWIGGLGLLMMAVVPSLRKSVPGELVKPLANAIYRKYQRIIGALMLIILVTGGINIAYVNRLMKRSEEHTSELQSRLHLVCRLLLEKKKKKEEKNTNEKETHKIPDK